MAKGTHTKCMFMSSILKTAFIINNKIYANVEHSLTFDKHIYTAVSIPFPMFWRDDLSTLPYMTVSNVHPFKRYLYT